MAAATRQTEVPRLGRLDQMTLVTAGEVFRERRVERAVLPPRLHRAGRGRLVVLVSVVLLLLMMLLLSSLMMVLLMRGRVH